MHVTATLTRDDRGHWHAVLTRRDTRDHPISIIGSDARAVADGIAIHLEAIEAADRAKPRLAVDNTHPPEAS